MFIRRCFLLGKDKEASLKAKHLGKRAPPQRENTIDFQPVAYWFLVNFWKLKKKRPKSDYLVNAEKEFLAERKKIPEGYILNLTQSDVEGFSPAMQSSLSLNLANSAERSKARKALLIEKFGNGPLDSNSTPVRIAILTEKVLNLRAHLIQRPKDNMAKSRMQILLGSRMRAMRKLYSEDFPLYEWTCKELGIKCVRFSVPSKNPSVSVNPLAVDGDRAKFLIRQKLWKGKHRPKREPAPDGRGQGILYSKHPVEAPPENHGKPTQTPQQVNSRWPYGVSKERVEGTHKVANPTAPGKGYIPASIAW